MAKSKIEANPEVTLKKALKELNDFLKRANPVSQYHSDNRLLIMTPRCDSLVIEIGIELWRAFIESGVEVKELDPNSFNYDQQMKVLQCAENLHSKEWINLEAGELFIGKKIDISESDGVPYTMTLDKTLLGVRLKKNEFTNIAYRVIERDNKQILSIKKYWDDFIMKNKEPLIGTNFTTVISYYIG